MLIAANWKMNNDLNDINDFYKFFQAHEISPDVDMCIIPQHPLIYEAKKLFEKTKIKIGSQSSHYKSEGPFTGDVSPQLLSNIGCEYVITGHSERRKFHFESDQFVKNTALSIISKKMIPIICVGETLKERKNKNTKSFIKKQILNSVPLVSDVEIIVAYEPVWAIGTGVIPELEEIDEVHHLIKNELSSLDFLKVIYGGSVNKSNSMEIFSLENVDGGLIGGASLNYKDFLAIYNSAVKQIKIN